MAKVIITGANRGIGLELCRQLAERGDVVTAVCRQPSDSLESLDIEVVDGIDVTDSESVAGLAENLQGQAFDWLINNAGILVRDYLGGLDFEGMRSQFEVNAIGPLMITSATLPCLREGSKIGIITSRMGSIGDNTSGGYYGYRMSKAAVNIAGKSLSVDLQELGIAVAILHPGMVATDMTGGQGVTVAHSAAGLIARMDGLTLETSGSFWHAEGEPLPW